MSVISRNPFDLLGDSEPAAPVAAPKAADKAPAAAQTPREVPGSKPARGRGGYNRGGPRNVLKSNATDAAEVNTVDPESGFEGERRAPNRADRGGKTPRGRGEGARGGRGGARTPRAARNGADRGHEGRRSANAHPDSEKKVASGWGAEEGSAELTAEVEGEVDATKDAAAAATEEWGATETPAAEPAAAAEAEAKPVEEEDNTKSYDEYLAERASKALEGVPQLEKRTVEGTSDFVGEALKKTDDVYFSAAKKTQTEKTKAPKKEKVFIEFEGKFAPPAREGGAREGGRGGARGGRGGARGGATRGGDKPFRGAGRGGRGGAKGGNSAPRVAVDDEKAFPALGA